MLKANQAAMFTVAAVLALSLAACQDADQLDEASAGAIGGAPAESDPSPVSAVDTEVPTTGLRVTVPIRAEAEFNSGDDVSTGMLTSAEPTTSLGSAPTTSSTSTADKSTTTVTTAGSSSTATSLTTVAPTTASPTTAVPTTAAPTTASTTTAMPSTAVPTTSSGGELDQAEAASLALLNELRTSLGLGTVSMSDREMSEFARSWSTEMRQSGFRHSTARWSENIVWYSAAKMTPAEAAAQFHKMWVNSPGHYRNMTSEGWTIVGIGFHHDESGWWGTHVFR